jgi:hypothetical protein
MRDNRQFVCLLAVLLAMFLLSGFALARDEFNPEGTIEVLRGDMRANKGAIVAEAMAFQASKDGKFWPGRHSHKAEAIILNNEQLKLTREYGEKYRSLNDTQANGMEERSFDWQTCRTHLQRKYFTHIAEATSDLTDAKLFHLEHRFDLGMDLVVASEMPSLFLESVDG